MRRKRDHVIGEPCPTLPIAFRGDADAIWRLDNDLLRGQKAVDRPRDLGSRQPIGALEDPDHHTLTACGYCLTANFV